MSGLGRFLPLGVALRQHTMMLQCMRRESAMIGHSAHEKTNFLTSAIGRSYPVTAKQHDNGKPEGENLRHGSADESFNREISD